MIFKNIIITLIFLSTNAWAGPQVYEKMKEETLHNLSRSILDTSPEISSFSNTRDEKIWIDLQKKNLKKFQLSTVEENNLLKSIHYESTRAGLEPEIILGLIEVESGFNKYAVSSVSALGLMQVMPFWLNTIGKNEHNLFNIKTNLRYGNTILKHYLDIENGNMTRALARYNGSLGQFKYPLAVQKAAEKYRNSQNLIISNLEK